MNKYIVHDEKKEIFGETVEKALLENLSGLSDINLNFDRIDSINMCYNETILGGEGGVECIIIGINITHCNLAKKKILCSEKRNIKVWIYADKNELQEEKEFLKSDSDYIKNYNQRRYQHFAFYSNVDDFYSF